MVLCRPTPPKPSAASLNPPTVVGAAADIIAHYLYTHHHLDLLHNYRLINPMCAAVSQQYLFQIIRLREPPFHSLKDGPIQRAQSLLGLIKCRPSLIHNFREVEISTSISQHYLLHPAIASLAEVLAEGARLQTLTIIGDPIASPANGLSVYSAFHPLFNNITNLRLTNVVRLPYYFLQGFPHLHDFLARGIEWDGTSGPVTNSSVAIARIFRRPPIPIDQQLKAGVDDYQDQNGSTLLAVANPKLRCLRLDTTQVDELADLLLSTNLLSGISEIGIELSPFIYETPTPIVPSLRLRRVPTIVLQICANFYSVKRIVTDPLVMLSNALSAIHAASHVSLRFDVIGTASCHSFFVRLCWGALDQGLVDFAQRHERVNISFRFLRQSNPRDPDSLIFAGISRNFIHKSLPKAMTCKGIVLVHKPVVKASYTLHE